MLPKKNRVFLEQPANSTIYPGCPFTLGYRVQFSDLAMLRWVQLQLLDHTNSILVESIDNTTRAEWGDVRGKNVTWTMPSNWVPGDYIVRAFGNASYPCTQNGHRTMCDFALEDRETLHLLPLAVSQGCPSESETTEGDNTTGASRTLTSQSGKVNDKKTEANTTRETMQEAPEGMRIVINQALVQQIQDQEIHKWIALSSDVDMANSTVTLTNGTVVAISNIMDSATASKLAATLEASNAAGVNTTALLEMMHQDTSMIVIPSESGINGAMAIDSRQGGYEVSLNGTETAEPQKDLNQVQDKTRQSNNGSERVRARWGVVVVVVSVAMTTSGW
ncbi:hypothetical protein BG006_001655 [Podila minutissima]|uniref:Uncharacterized protein n=1 Tax=Podila minutissima TaxID=64525 RepID=A0A9P5VH44_9FUNG|nr:hypothetical protein BG006_001655 [Podila minutissima]